MNIPDQAIQAAAISLTLTGTMEDWEEMSDNRRRLYEHSAEAALQAALPHIEKALRTQIAADIRQSSIDMQDAADTFAVGSYSGTVALKAEGMSIATRIVEKGTTK